MKKTLPIYTTALIFFIFFSCFSHELGDRQPWLHQQRVFTRLCFEGKWLEIRRLLENGFIPNAPFVLEAISARNKIHLWRKCCLYSCTTFTSIMLSYIIDDKLKNAGVIPTVRLHSQCILSAACGMCSLVMAELTKDDPIEQARAMLRLSLDWTQQRQLVTEQPRYPVQLYNKRHTPNFMLGETDIIDTGSFDPDSGMYSPNFMSADSFAHCYIKKTPSSSGFTFELPGKKVISLDDYLFGSNNPFTREQRNYIDVEKINLYDKISLEPLTVSVEESVKISRRFHVPLTQEELKEMCRQSIHHDSVELPLLAQYIKKKI